jgi:hypothetical protein
MRLVGFVIAMIALPSAALADAAAIGIGVQNCSQLSKDFGNDAVKADLAYTNWAFGFLSGVNLAFEVAGKTRRNLTAMSFEDKKAYLRSYCDRNPAKTPMDGAVEMYGKMDVFK